MCSGCNSRLYKHKGTKFKHLWHETSLVIMILLDKAISMSTVVIAVLWNGVSLYIKYRNSVNLSLLQMCWIVESAFYCNNFHVSCFFYKCEMEALQQSIYICNQVSFMFVYCELTGKILLWSKRFWALKCLLWPGTRSFLESHIRAGDTPGMPTAPHSLSLSLMALKMFWL